MAKKNGALAAPNANSKYHQGYYKPQFPEKYQGDPNNIIYRSGWELACMRKFDTNPNVLLWTSEGLEIRYKSPIDRKIHRYFPDFIIKKRGRDGTISICMIEIKPLSQTKKPIKTEKTRNKRHLIEMAQWGVNETKWAAARAYCKKKGWSFQIITEKHLRIG